MIIDWKTQCQKIDETHLLSRSDPSDNKVFFKQEIIYVRYLIELGLDREECYRRWLMIGNGVASQFGSDREQLKAQFNRTYTKAQAKGYMTIDFSKGLKPVKVFVSEVRKINAIKCPKWIKEYMLTLLVYYKFAHQLGDKVEYSPTLTNWALRQVNWGDYKFRSYRDARKYVAQVLRETKPRIIRFSAIKEKEHYTTYSIPFLCKEGKGLMTLKSLDDVQDVFEVLKDNFAICERCGEPFTTSPQTKTRYCQKCYQELRRQYKTAKDREYYYKTKEKLSKHRDF